MKVVSLSKADVEVCPYCILQELILNFNFSKYEIARFIRMHSKRITFILENKEENIYKLMRNEQINQLMRIYKRIRDHDFLIYDGKIEFR